LICWQQLKGLLSVEKCSKVTRAPMAQSGSDYLHGRDIFVGILPDDLKWVLELLKVFGKHALKMNNYCPEFKVPK